MHRSFRSLAAALLLLGASALTTACHEPPAALPPPVGTSVRMWQERQIYRGNQDSFVIYTNEWLADDSLQLGPYGRRHIVKIARELPLWPYQVMIQPEEADPQLDQMRRDQIVKYLLEQNIVNAPDRVVVQRPISEGLDPDQIPGVRD